VADTDAPATGKSTFFMISMNFSRVLPPTHGFIDFSRTNASAAAAMDGRSGGNVIPFQVIESCSVLKFPGNCPIYAATPNQI
jgi:hypothetical protein